MKKRSYMLISNTNKHFIYGCLALVVSIFVFQLTPIDFEFQKLFYTEGKGWLLGRGEEPYRLIFYYVFKKTIVTFSILILLANLYYFYKSHGRVKYKVLLRRKLLFIVLSMILVPLLVAGSKQFTNMYCPEQVKEFGGNKPFVRLFQDYPEGFLAPKKGKCYPAGHATGGFGLLCLFFVFNKRRHRIFALCGAITIGWIMGLYQVMRGTHYFGDTVTSMIGAYLVVLVIYRLVLEKKLS